MPKVINPLVSIVIQTFLVILIIALFVGKLTISSPLPPVIDPLPVNPIPKPVDHEPGDHVEWIKYPKKKNYTNTAFGPVLIDIEQHIDPSHGGAYRDDDLLTWGHETTHGINRDIRINIGKVGQNGFYCLEDRAIVLNDPKLTITNVASLIPNIIRGSRYNLYLIDQAGQWDDMPTYLLDEWTAYINGTTVGADQLKHGLHVRDNKSDDAIAPMEFTYYSLALCHAIKKYDPDYFKSNPNFTEFVAFNIRRSVLVYREVINDEKFNWETTLIDSFINSPETNDLKNIAIELWGQDFANKYLLKK
jgi:hypothetical protein